MKIYNINKKVKKNRISFICQDETCGSRILKKAAGGEDIFEISRGANEHIHEDNLVKLKKAREEKEKEKQRKEIQELIYEQDKRAEEERRRRIARLKISMNNINAIQDNPDVLKETSEMIRSLFAL